MLLLPKFHLHMHVCITNWEENKRFSQTFAFAKYFGTNCYFVFCCKEIYYCKKRAENEISQSSAARTNTTTRKNENKLQPIHRSKYVTINSRQSCFLVIAFARIYHSQFSCQINYSLLLLVLELLLNSSVLAEYNLKKLKYFFFLVTHILLIILLQKITFLWFLPSLFG